MEYKDYYKILGVSRNAGEDEIKRSYRKLAQKYHPDHNPGNPNAEAQFKDINEAYQVLSDPEKRARYDQLGESYSSWQQRGAPQGGFNWSDWYSAPGSGRVQVDNLDDLFGGNFSEFFQRIFGGGGVDFNRMSQSQRGGPSTRSQIPAQEQPVTISLSEAYHGTTRRLEIDRRRLDVNIPAGARSGLKVRVADALTDNRTGQKMDLFLVVQVADDPRFERKGNDLYTTVSVDLYTAVLGGEIAVPTMTGNVILTIPESTQPDQIFRLAGKGMPHLKKPSTFGDLFVRVKVKLPTKLSPAQRELFQKLARA